MIKSILKWITDPKIIKVNSEMGELWLSEERMFIPSIINIESVKKELIGLFGERSADSILYMIGKEDGSKRSHKIMKQVKGGFEEKIRITLDIASVTGWGKIELIEANEKKKYALFESRNTFESHIELLENKKHKKPVCRVLSGLMASYASTILKKDVDVIELKCRGKGDEKCVFLVYPPEKRKEMIEYANRYI